MPSVGMRRTRVFGVVKGVDGARVLRSGRRLWPESGEVKLKKSKDASDWFRVIDNRGNGGGSGQGRLDCKWNPVRNVNPKRVIVADIHDEGDDCVEEAPKPIKALARTGGDGDSGAVDRMFGKVYRRKRRRDPSENIDVFDDMEGDNVLSGDRMFGLRFIRRQRTRKTGDDRWEPTSANNSKVYFSRQNISTIWDSVLTIFTENRSDGGCFSNFTHSVLWHLKRAVLRVTELSAFLLSDPIRGVFASNGVHFLQDYPAIGSSGICVIFGARQSMPTFFLDFSAIPYCFTYLHSRMFLRAEWTQSCLVNNSINKNEDVDVSSDSEEDSTEGQHVPSPLETSFLGCKTMAFGVDHPKSRPILHPSVRASRLAGRNMQHRNGLSSRGIRKRRSSLRMRKRRNPSLIAMQKTISSVASESIDVVKRRVSYSSVASYNKHKNLALNDSAGHLREVSSTALGSSMDFESSCCTANILIVESDKCLREGGANIVLELSASREWLLVVKKDGLTRYTHKAEKVMRPSSCNRFTHAIMWLADNGWKLEFSNRRDWLIFKDLYKECSDRNVSGSTAKTIPVPRVCEVPGYVDSSSASFRRPDSYLSLKDDEVCRAMAKTTANYDMDSEDEEWLDRFNDELIAKDNHHEYISGDNFELIIDALEKGFYCNPDAFLNEKAPADLGMHLGTRQIIESVFTYWMKKRRQKRSSLVRVFQAHLAKRKPPVVPKPVMRRRRSLKRKPTSQSGKYKQPNILQATVSKQDALEDQNTLLKFQEAKASAKGSIESAVRKRQRAQLLLENADLAAYKAMMALRIAEAIQISKMPEAAASSFLE